VRSDIGAKSAFSQAMQSAFQGMAAIRLLESSMRMDKRRLLIASTQFPLNLKSEARDEYVLPFARIPLSRRHRRNSGEIGSVLRQKGVSQVSVEFAGWANGIATTWLARL
jgi:hypothetical protein